MKKLWVKMLLFVAGTSLLVAQTAPRAQPSLADLARKARAEKAATPKAKRVFDNDNLPHDSPLVSEVGPAPAPKASDKDGKAGEKGEAKPGDKGTEKPAAGTEKPKEEEAPWRARFAKLRGNLDTEKRRLDVLQRELNLAQVQSYSDPNQALREQFSRNEINKRTAELDA